MCKLFTYLFKKIIKKIIIFLISIYNSKPSTQYATGSTCYDRKEFRESCKNDNQCVDSLQCDLDDRVCLKKDVLACENNSECVNNLGCQDNKLCGCGAQVYIYIYFII